ncbi:hypothetical protein [Alicyclobacillus mengziensis]|uniref:Uncharacterized protein n=1 Tax=Alicyclobacillus mengziensis TaxID=2931921 RepID=A0A9X7W4C6_9BACL|nr:hypothetical protein [Alicyclobacillus mengziensis]QSO50142.1 hypothetical protein JZ786_24560 [Alicyclobacillus mengziensis]
MGQFLTRAIWVAAGLALVVGIGIAWMASNMNTASTTGTTTVSKEFQNPVVTGTSTTP